MEKVSVGRHSQDRRSAAPAPSRPRTTQERRGAHRAEPAGAPLRGALLTGGKAAVLAAVVAGTGAFASGQGDGANLPTAQALTTGDLVDRASGASRAADRTALEATFTAVVDGERQEITTAAGTLGDALAEADVVVGPQDIVSAPLTAQVTDGMTVEVKHVVSERVTEETVTEHGVVEEEDDTLPKGERVVETEGVDGVSSVVYEVARTVTGEEVSREVVAEIVGSRPVDEVVRVGTREETAVPLPSDVSGNRAIGARLAAARGWGGEQFECLDALWTRESGWITTADNPTSSAYGIPQALPGSKMASHGADWATNPATQIAWGLDYIGGRYGTPCNALSHSNAVGWY